jgi:hypothetical protein
MTQHTPLPGPIEELPLSAVTDVEARAQLAAATDGLPLGGCDAEFLEWLAATDTRATVVVASLLRRAWTAGLAAGRMEIREERTR